MQTSLLASHEGILFCLFIDRARGVVPSLILRKRQSRSFWGASATRVLATAPRRRALFLAGAIAMECA